MHCLNCGEETKNPKFCNRKCAAEINSKLNIEKLWRGECKDCGITCSNRYSRCEKCRDIYHNNVNNGHCLICGILQTTKNSVKRTYKNGWNPYCNPCGVQKDILYRREIKLSLINYKGGCCQQCGYNVCPAALQFHHIDPNIKEFNISKFRIRKLTDSMKLELEKCLILCSNCHFEHHYNEMKINTQVIDYYNKNIRLAH